MSTVTEMIHEQSLPLAPFGQFIKHCNDLSQYEYGFFGIYCKDRLLNISIMEDIIVGVGYESAYSNESGVGHIVTLFACTTDLTQRWECTVSYRDMHYEYKDWNPVAPNPKEFRILKKDERGNLIVTAFTTSDTTEEYTLVPKQRSGSIYLSASRSLMGDD